MTTMSSNPFPSTANISGPVCNLLLTHESSTIELSNLPEMIEVNSQTECGENHRTEEGHGVLLNLMSQPSDASIKV